MNKNLGTVKKENNIPVAFPQQHQDVHPGAEHQMNPKPVFDNPEHKGSGKLSGLVALITGGDSGIGKAVAILYAKEGADIAISYFNEDTDANETKKIIEGLGRKCLIINGDVKDEKVCGDIVNKTIQEYNHLDILVNNAGVQYVKNSIEDITAEQLETTFKTNIFSMFYVTKAALPHLKGGSAIINTASITAYEGSKELIDYSSTKGAIVAFTRSLALSLVQRGIRVNAVAPGPIWTPLIPSSFSAEDVKTFGTDTPMKRAGQPVELAPAYLFLASQDSTYITGQVLHVNGGGSTSS